MKIKHLFLFVLLMLLFSCKEDSDPAINPELSFYVERFVEEGIKRGRNISTENLQAKLVDQFSIETPSNVCGYGWSNFDTRGTQRIEILNNSNCWIDRTEIEKENIVFHELGHAILDRPHYSALLPNNTTPISIMCSSICSNYGVFHVDGPLKDFYLDELFNPNTEFPNTFLNKEFSRVLFQDDFGDNTFDWEVFSTTVEEDLSKFDFRIDPNSNSMAISSRETIPDGLDIIVLKRFDISDFQDCSNVVANATIRTEGILNGRGAFGMSISLRERNGQGGLERFYLNTRRQELFSSDNNTFNDFEMETYCIPLQTDVVTVSFRISFTNPATFFVDDIVIELLE